MSVEIIDTATPELVKAMNALIPQLSTSTPPLSDAQVAEFVAQPAVYLFVYRPEIDAFLLTA